MLKGTFKRKSDAQKLAVLESELYAHAETGHRDYSPPAGVIPGSSVKRTVTPSFFSEFADKSGWTVDRTVDRALSTADKTADFDAILLAAKGPKFVAVFEDLRMAARAMTDRPLNGRRADEMAYEQTKQAFAQLRPAQVPHLRLVA